MAVAGAVVGEDTLLRRCLDIGEGAAALVQAPGGPTVLIDAGPSPLAHTLRAHGVRSGGYLSPHISGWSERVIVDGRPVEDSVLGACVEVVRRVGSPRAKLLWNSG